MGAAMHMSAPGRAQLVERFEGLRLPAYRDSVGVWTIGYGHTARAGGLAPGPGVVITAAQADAILSQDLGTFEAALNAAIRAPALQREFDALLSWSFNVGAGAMRSSSLMRAFNAGQKARAAQGLLAWDRAGGAVLQGLETRRAAERAWFLGQVAGEPDGLMSADALIVAFTEAHALDHPDGILTRLANRAALAFS